MVPATFVLLEALPVPPKGKVDRAALPAPGAPNTLQDAVEAFPSTPIQKRLNGIGAPLLGLQQIGIHANIFLLGGTSLIGTQVIVRGAEAFSVEIPLRTLFD